MFLSKQWNPQLTEDFRGFYHAQISEQVEKTEVLGYIPKELMKSLGDEGYFNSIGDDFKQEIHFFAAVLKEIAKVSASVALSYHINHLCALVISMRMEESDIKQQLIKRIKSGNALCAFALTEPRNGSDLSSMDTVVEEDENGYSVTGTKKYIVNGVNADFFIVAARQDQGVYTLLLEKEQNEHGIMGEKLETLGVKGSGLATVSFKTAKANHQNLLATSLKDVLSAINFDRVGAIIMALGMAESAFEKALAYIRERQQFGQNIGDFQGIQFIIAEMAADLKIINHLADTELKDFAADRVNITSLAVGKLEATRLAEKIASKAVDLMGGNGYLMENEVERIFRDSKSVAIGGGTREVLKNMIGKQMVYKYQI